MIRWTPNRKRMLVRAIRLNQIAFDEACILHDISKEELQIWMAVNSKGEKIKFFKRRAA